MAPTVAILLCFACFCFKNYGTEGVVRLFLVFQNKQEMRMKITLWNSLNKIRKRSKMRKTSKKLRKGKTGYDYVMKIPRLVEAVVSLAGL